LAEDRCPSIEGKTHPGGVSGKNREGEYKRTIVKVSKLSDDIKTGGHKHPRDKPIGNLFTGWAVSGIEMARARFRHFKGTVGTVGTQYRDVKGGRQVKKSEMKSTDARIEVLVGLNVPGRTGVHLPALSVLTF
jgi:hypothetical protein